MNKNFNEWYIDVSIQPKEGQLEKRAAGVERFAKDITVETVINLTKLFFNFPVGDDFKETFADNFIVDDASFSKRYTKELAVLAGATLVEIAETNGSFDNFVELLSIATSFGGRTPIAFSILETIKELFGVDSLALRETSNEYDVDIKIPATKSLEEVLPSGWNEEWQKQMAKYIQGITQTLNSIGKELYDFKRSQKIYREDSQILWWLTSGWSKDLGCSFKTIDMQNACLVIGKETASLVSVFPGPYAINAVINKMIENCKGKKNLLDFTDVIQTTDMNWKAEYIKAYNNPRLYDLLPISSALLRAENTSAKEEWLPKYICETNICTDKMKDTPYVYALQMYLEVLTLKCCTYLENK